MLDFEARRGLRLGVLSVIWRLLEASTAPSLEIEVRAILQFLCSSLERDAGLQEDTGQLLCGLLRASVPPPGLYPALDVITKANPNTFAAMIVSKMVDTRDDGLRAVGLRIMTAYMARAGFQRKDRDKDMAARMKGLKQALGTKKGLLGRFYGSGGLALVWAVLLKVRF